MSSYAGIHRRAASTVARKGAAVTFSRTTLTETESTGALSPATTTIAGNAVQDKEDARRYELLGLIVGGKTTLFFIPATLGECPIADDTTSWGGATKKVDGVERLAPNGDVIGAWVIVS